ncbi:hypothetical protein MesoLjLb_32310 [Mesorhizobium sp. L-8-3]|nr:hypothetical protein MesoLjLb_32310 [Mesorhizobium sp. L-8-3]
MNFALGYVEVNTVHRPEGAETLRDASNPEYRVRQPFLLGFRNPRRPGSQGRQGIPGKDRLPRKPGFNP